MAAGERRDKPSDPGEVGGAEGIDSHGAGDGLARGESPGQLAQQVALGERWERFGYGARSPGTGKREQDAGDRGVDFLVVLDLSVAEVEERLPSDVAPRGRVAAEQVVPVVGDRAGEVGSVASKTSAKNGSAVGLVLSPVPLVKFARYDGRTMLWPNR